MRCWACDTELIWGGDHEVEDSEEFTIVSNFSCPKCNAYVEFYTPASCAELLLSDMIRDGRKLN